MTGEILWTPPADVLETSQLGRYLTWLKARRGQDFGTYDEIFRWSVDELEAFWESLWEYFEIRAHTPYEQVLSAREMPGAKWFAGARLNYAEHALGRDEDAGRSAVVAHSQSRAPIELTFGELREQVGRARAGLERLGVGPGDRVVAYLPNVPETLIAFLATASIGAVWATCAPEFGPRSVIARFGIVEPKVLLTVAGYRYGERLIDRRSDVASIRAALPTLEHVVHVPYPGGAEDEISAAQEWDDLLREDAPARFDAVPFDHPLCILFSSGTTGLPKAIVHGHGGITIEHHKNHALSWDLRPGDRLMWFSTTAWMMWNALVSALLTRSSIVMIDGNPAYPGLEYQWQLAADTGATMMGLSPAFLMACRKAGIEPAKQFDLSKLRSVGAAGSPLPPEGFDWIYEQLGPDVLLACGSGGTDVCTGIVQGSPLQPVYRGEMSGCCLAVDAAAYDVDGNPVVGELGELVIRAPMPSMPVKFWNDPGDERYHAAYFEQYPGIWRHGDWILFTERGSCVITGRSDATLNRGGVRLGTGELYAVVEELPEVLDSLIVHLEDPGGGAGELLLFVVLAEGHAMDDELRARMATTLRTALSPRHVPDAIEAVPAIPRTFTAKKLELPVKRILQGAKPEDVASRDALAQPEALDAFVTFAERRRGRSAVV
ncbi:MAG: acetoacetate--CoA ligase [Solirubrobacteraceae bacterium]